MAEGRAQVVVDAGTAKNEHYKLGEQIVITTRGQKRSYKRHGHRTYGDVDKLGFASIAVWDLPTAQKLLDREGRYDQISIAAKKGDAPSEVVTPSSRSWRTTSR